MWQRQRKSRHRSPLIPIISSTPSTLLNFRHLTKVLWSCLYWKGIYFCSSESLPAALGVEEIRSRLVSRGSRWNLRHLWKLYFIPPLSQAASSHQQPAKSTQVWRQEEVQEKNSMLLHLLYLQCYLTFFSLVAWSLTSLRAMRYCSDSDELFWSVPFCLSAAEMLSFFSWSACSNLVIRILLVQTICWHCPSNIPPRTQNQEKHNIRNRAYLLFNFFLTSFLVLLTSASILCPLLLLAV